MGFSYPTAVPLAAQQVCVGGWGWWGGGGGVGGGWVVKGWHGRGRVTCFHHQILYVVIGMGVGGDTRAFRSLHPNVCCPPLKHSMAQ
jgi:hypothetical protein